MASATWLVPAGLSPTAWIHAVGLVVPPVESEQRIARARVAVPQRLAVACPELGVGVARVCAQLEELLEAPEIALRDGDEAVRGGGRRKGDAGRLSVTCRFFECSESMALTSREVADGVNSGAVKKPAKRARAGVRAWRLKM